MEVDALREIIFSYPIVADVQTCLACLHFIASA